MDDKSISEVIQDATTEKECFNIFNRCFPCDSNDILNYRERVYFFRELWRRAMQEGRDRARREMAKAIFGGDLFKVAPEVFKDSLSIPADDTGLEAHQDDPVTSGIQNTPRARGNED